MRWSSRLFPPLAFAVGGALLIWIASFLIPDRYTSSAMIRLRVEAYSEADTINIAYSEAISRETLKSVIERLNLYPEERERLPLEDVIESMKKEDIALDIPPGRPVQMSFTYHDPGVAQAGANALMKEMISASGDYYRKEPGFGRLEITQAAGPGEAKSTLAFWLPRRYVAQGTMEVRQRNAPAIDKDAAEKRAESLRQSALSREHLAILCDKRSEWHDANAWRLSYDEPDELRKDLRIDRKANIFIIKFSYPDAGVAQKAVTLLLNMLIDENRGLPPCAPAAPPGQSIASSHSRLESDLFQADPNDAIGRIAANTWEAQMSLPSHIEPCRDPNTRQWQGVIDLLDPASVPAAPDGPSRPILAVFGLFLGLGAWATNFKKPAN